MGLFDDVAHAIGSVVNSLGQVVAAPFNFANQLIHGENIGDAAKDLISTEGSNLFNISSGGVANFIASTSGQDILRNSVVDKISFGLSDDLAGSYQSIADLAKGISVNNLPSQERDEFIRAVVNGAAIAGGVALIPGAVPTTIQGAVETAGAVSAGETAVNKKNIAGILGAGADLSGDEYLGDAAYIAGAVQSSNTSGAKKAPPQRQGQGASPIPSAQGSGSASPTIGDAAVIGGGMFLLAKLVK